MSVFNQTCTIYVRALIVIKHREKKKIDLWILMPILAIGVLVHWSFSVIEIVDTYKVVRQNVLHFLLGRQ